MQTLLCKEVQSCSVHRSVPPVVSWVFVARRHYLDPIQQQELRKAFTELGFSRNLIALEWTSLTPVFERFQLVGVAILLWAERYWGGVACQTAQRWRHYLIGCTTTNIGTHGKSTEQTSFDPVTSRQRLQIGQLPYHLPLSAESRIEIHRTYRRLLRAHQHGRISRYDWTTHPNHCRQYCRHQ